MRVFRYARMFSPFRAIALDRQRPLDPWGLYENDVPAGIPIVNHLQSGSTKKDTIPAIYR